VEVLEALRGALTGFEGGEKDRKVTGEVEKGEKRIETSAIPRRQVGSVNSMAKE
jgi:hypothetical protein